jgi:hypothetical protein
VAEPAEQYYPSDDSYEDPSGVDFGDEEIPGQDALWESPKPAHYADARLLDAPSINTSAADTTSANAPAVDADAESPHESAGGEYPATGTRRDPAPSGARPGDRSRGGRQGLKPPPAAGTRLGASRGRANPSTAPNRRPSTEGVGITGRGVVVLITAIAALVGVIDVIASGSRGPLFGVAFVVAAAASAYLVRRRDLLVSVVAPPLIYCVLIGFMSLIDSGGTPGGLTTRVGVYIGDAFATGAPSIWLGTAAAAAISWWRAGGSWKSAPPAVAAKFRRGSIVGRLRATARRTVNR